METFEVTLKAFSQQIKTSTITIKSTDLISVIPAKCFNMNSFSEFCSQKLELNDILQSVILNESEEQ